MNKSASAMNFSALPVWASNASLGAKVLWTLTAPDRPALGETLRERLEEALAAIQGSLEGFTAELVEAGL